MDKLREFLDRKPVIALDFEAELRQMVADMKVMREALEFYANYIGNTVEEGLYVNDTDVPDYGYIAKQSLTETEKYLPLFEEGV